MNKKTRMIVWMLAVVLCLNLCVPVLAVNETNTAEAEFRVALSASELTESSETQTVTMTIAADKAITAAAGSFTVKIPQGWIFVGCEAPSESMDVICNTESTSEAYGYVSWMLADDNALLTGAEITAFGTVTYTVPVNAAAGEYTLGVENIYACTVTDDVEGAEDGTCPAAATATLTINAAGAGAIEPTVTAGKNVTITAPSGGWVTGENTFTVESEKACAVLISNDNGTTYTHLSPTKVTTTCYSFTAGNVTGNSIIVAYWKGDLDGNGSISTTEVLKARLVQAELLTLSSLEKGLADLDGNNAISTTEVLKIRLAQAKLLNLEW